MYDVNISGLGAYADLGAHHFRLSSQVYLCLNLALVAFGGLHSTSRPQNLALRGLQYTRPQTWHIHLYDRHRKEKKMPHIITAFTPYLSHPWTVKAGEPETSGARERYAHAGRGPRPQRADYVTLLPGLTSTGGQPM